MGKTTLASEFPNAVFLQIEEGDGNDRAHRSASSTLRRGDGRARRALHRRSRLRTVVVDSITELQRLIFAETCARGDDKGNAKANIEDFGYGKGYVYALRDLGGLPGRHQRSAPRQGHGIVLIAHSRVKRFDDPETVSYDRYEIDLHEKAVGMIEREMDAIFLLKRPVIVKQDDVGFNKKRSAPMASAMPG
jgi:hypothetical protein